LNFKAEFVKQFKMTHKINVCIDLMIREITRCPEDWLVTGYSQAGSCGGFQGNDTLIYEYIQNHTWVGDKFKVKMIFTPVRESKIIFKKELVFYYDNNMRIPIGVTTNDDNDTITFQLNSRKKKTITFKLCNGI